MCYVRNLECSQGVSLLGKTVFRPQAEFIKLKSSEFHEIFLLSKASLAHMSILTYSRAHGSESC